MTHEDELRRWAKGSYTYEAATELLLRAFGGRYAKPGQPWMMAEEITGRVWIDFASIPGHVEGLSGGERRFLMLAASLVEDVPVVLGDVVPGLDRQNLDLVLAAIAHAGGSHQHSDIRRNGDGSMTLHPGYMDSLHPWPRSLHAV
jgi:hypothetical protein